jgi:hypothetical protein
LAAFGSAVRAELAPVGAVHADLVARIVSASWRARRADRLAASLLGRHLADVSPCDRGDLQLALGFGLMRDRNGPSARNPGALPRRGAGRAVALARRPRGAPGVSPKAPGAAPAMLELT